MRYTPYLAQKCQEDGVNFDSKLERKYARFFTACGFEWEREPVAFPNWLPDFVVSVGEQRYLIEVKPSASFFDVSKTEIALKRGLTVVLLPESPLSAITFIWKGEVTPFRSVLPENTYDLWQACQ